MNQPTLTLAAELLLQGADQKLITAFKKSLTLANPKYEAAKKYGRWVGKKIPQNLTFYKERKAGLCMPRGFTRQALEICASFGVQPELRDQRRECPPIDLTFYGSLRPYQDEALEALAKKEFGVLEAGTGSGKTVMALALIARRAQPTLILVHTKELLYQWAERIRTFLRQEAGLIGDSHMTVEPVTVAIVHSAKKSIREINPHFGHIVVDECHRVPTTLFTDVVRFFDGRYSLGLSATAYRRENVLTRLIYFFMGEPGWRVDPRVLQAYGAILRPQIIARRTGFSYRYRDDYAAMLTALTLDDPRNRQIADDVSSEVRKQPGTVLVVSDRLAHCQRLTELIMERGGVTRLLTGRTPMEQRVEIVEEVRRGEIDVLVSTLQLIGEGFDAKGLSTLFLATPIKFSGRLLQVIGRILRPDQGKQARVFDYVDENVGVLKASARKRQQTYLSIV